MISWLSVKNIFKFSFSLCFAQIRLDLSAALFRKTFQPFFELIAFYPHTGIPKITFQPILKSLTLEVTHNQGPQIKNFVNITSCFVNIIFSYGGH